MLGSQAEIIVPFLSSALPIPLLLPCLLLNGPVRLGHSLHRFFQRLALVVEPFLFFEQGGFLLFQCREVTRWAALYRHRYDCHQYFSSFIAGHRVHNMSP